MQLSAYIIERRVQHRVALAMSTARTARQPVWFLSSPRSLSLSPSLSRSLSLSLSLSRSRSRSLFLALVFLLLERKNGRGGGRATSSVPIAVTVVAAPAAVFAAALARSAAVPADGEEAEGGQEEDNAGQRVGSSLPCADARVVA